MDLSQHRKKDDGGICLPKETDVSQHRQRPLAVADASTQGQDAIFQWQELVMAADVSWQRQTLASRDRSQLEVADIS